MTSDFRKFNNKVIEISKTNDSIFFRWEGKSDKMTQGYALCVLDYEFQILDNGFLVHKPGIKILKKDPKRAMLAAKTNQLIKKIIYPELQVMYGKKILKFLIMKSSL